MRRVILVAAACLLTTVAAWADYKPLPDHDGDFGAMLLVIDDAQLKEFDNPASTGMQFKGVDKIKTGQIIAVKIIFAGMTLNASSMADVTYDLKIIGPDGKIFGGGEIKDQVAMRDKLTTDRFLMYDNKAFVKFSFDTDDKPGKYQIVAEVRDNIGKKKIPLATTIELVR